MGTTAQKLEYLNTTKTKIKESINLTGANITTETFRNYAVILKDTLASLLKDPTPIWTNFPKVEATGTSFTISSYNSLFEMKLSGDTVQNGTPAPDNEVPVQTVSGRQVIGVNSDSYNIDLTGKNLFDKDHANILTNTYMNSSTSKLASANGTKTLYIPITGGLTYTVSKIVSARFCIGTTEILPAIDVTVANMTQNNSATSLTITTSSDAKYLCVFYLHSSDTISEQTILDSIMIEEGSIATTYSSYYDYELCKIGTYQDYIYKNSGKWCVHKEVKKVIFNGNESWSYDSTNSVFINNLVLSNEQYLVQNAYSNYFTNIVNANITNNYTAGQNLQNGQFSFRLGTKDRLYLKNTSYTDTTNFKTWLGTHNTIVYYILATATDTEITNSDLINQLDSIALANGTNVITVSGTLPAILYIKALEN